MQHSNLTATSFTFSDQEFPVRMGKYHLLSRLLRDPISEQFLAAWGVAQGMDQLRVIRCIYPRVAQEAEFIGLFQEEARALSRLSSDNIARIMEVSVQGDIPFVAREYVEGVTLERLMALSITKNRPIPWELAGHIVTEVLRGLDYIHRREDIHGNPMGMRHGDVRPGNILVSFTGEVKLINFGSMLRFIVDEATHAQLIQLRSPYTPPECRDDVDPSESADLWAVAMIFNSLMGGELPEPGQPAWEPQRISKIVDGAPSVLDDFVARALAENPDERFKTAAAMRSVLVEIMGDHAAGHPPDDLAVYTATVGKEDSDKVQSLVRSMLKKPAEMTLENTTSSSSAIGPGHVLDGRYHLIRLLGEGGMGTVFEAEHQGLGKRCAVKVLHERVMSDASTVERFKREAQIIGNIGHPNIVGAHDFGICDRGYYYLAMDLLDGKPLSHRIWAGDLSYYDIAMVMAEVCDGLQAAHEAGVIHRDLKPDNVHLTTKGARILDFGIAKSVGLDSQNEALTRTGHICGTVDYIAPEQIRGASDEPRSDLYAVGVMIYECLTGETPFHGRTVGEALHKAINDKLVTPSKRSGKKDIPTQLEAICVRALHRNAEKRHASAKDMAAALRDVAAKLQVKMQRDADEEAGAVAMSDEIQTGTRLTLWLPLVAGGVILVVVVLMLTVFKKNADVPAQNMADGEPKAASDAPDASASSMVTVLSATPTAVDTESSNEVKPTTAIDTSDPDVVRMMNELRQKEKGQEESLKLAAELVKSGNEKLKKRDYAGAKTDFTEAVRHNHRAGDAWFGLGRTAFATGEYGAAADHVQKSLLFANTANSVKRRNFLGMIYKASGDSQKAESEWRKVLALHPDNAEAMRNLGQSAEKGNI